MDGHEFDAITKALTRPGAPRRRVLKALAGGAVAGLTAVMRGAAAPHRSRGQADSTPTRTPTPASSPAPSPTPTPTPSPTCPCPCPPNACPPPRVIEPVTCECRCPEIICPVGQTLDPTTCQCRCPCPCPPITCPHGQTQDPTTCQCACPPGQMLCGDVCCTADQTCVSGQCRDGGVCTVASFCPEKHYCNEAEDCLCARTPEGNIRCGARPSCGAETCQTSADCAHLGDGYFCDTPNTGCCGDQLQRCLAPCQPAPPPCPAERVCGEECCAQGERCVNGACRALCTRDAECDDGDPCTVDTCDLTAGVCTHTPAPFGTPACELEPCPDCGICQVCSSSTAGAAPTGTCGAACDDPCTAAALCRQANQHAAYGQIRGYLSGAGYVRTQPTEAVILIEDGLLLRTVLFTQFDHPGRPGETAVLFYGVEASGDVWTYAIVAENNLPTSVVTIGANGQIEHQFPPSADSAGDTQLLVAQDGNASLAIGSDTGELASHHWSAGAQDMQAVWTYAIPAAQSGSSCYLCRLTCGLVGTFGCAVLLGLICNGAGAVCIWTLRGVCAVLFTGAICPAACQSFCQPPALGPFCRCTGACYPNASACLSSCRANLGCFTSICQSVTGCPL